MDSAGADTDRVSSGSLATTAARVVVVVAGACAVVGGGYLAHRAWNNHRRRVAEEGGGRKVVYLIRHGQSTFNAAYEQTGVDPMLFDAPLSALGVRQVAAEGSEKKEKMPVLVQGRQGIGGMHARRRSVRWTLPRWTKCFRALEAAKRRSTARRRST